MASAVTTPQAPAGGVFRQLLDIGYPGLVCVIPPGAPLKPDIPNFHGTSKSRGKCPGVLTPDGWVPYNYRTRPFDPDADPERFASWGGSVGLRLTGDLVAFDMDCRNKDLSNAIAKVVRAKLGPVPARVGLAPKALFLMRVHRDDLERIRYRALHFDDGTDKRAGIEILAQDRQCVLDGPYGIDGMPAGFAYRWPDGRIPAYSDLPVVRWSHIEAVLSECAEFLPKADRPGRASLAIVRTEVDQASLKTSEEHLARLVAAIPNARRYDALIEMAAAIRGAAQDHDDEGLAAFLEWCERWEDGEADRAYCERIFESLEPPFGLGVTRLEYLAGHGDGGSEGTGRIEVDPSRFLGALDQGAVDEAVALFPSLPEGGVSMADEDRPKRRFERVKFDDAEERRKNSKRRPLIKGLIDRGAMSILYGDSNVGKTFVALVGGHHVAQGKEFCGMKVSQGRVVYMTLEGGAGIDDRCIALLREAGPAPLFELIISPINLLDPDADLGQLIAALQPNEDGEVALAVLDTLSRALAGGDENSSTDMGALVVNLDRIRQATGAHLMVVHHTGKDAARGARGHSLLRAATDTEIEVGAGAIKVTKQRDLPKDWQGVFTLKSVPLFKDEDGDDVTSAVAVVSSFTGENVMKDARAQDTAGVVAHVAGREREVLEHLVSVFETSKQRPVSAGDIAALMGASLTQSNVRGMLLRLLKKGLASRVTQGSWRPTTSGAVVGKRTYSPDVGLLKPLNEDGNEVIGLFD